MREYVVDLIARLGEVIDDPTIELIELRQTVIVKQYHDGFDGIISRFRLSPRLSPATALSCFLTGLSDNIRNMVRMFNTTFISQTYSLVKLHEVNLNRHKSKPSYKPLNLPYTVSPKIFKYRFVSSMVTESCFNNPSIFVHTSVSLTISEEVTEDIYPLLRISN